MKKVDSKVYKFLIFIIVNIIILCNCTCNATTYNSSLENSIESTPVANSSKKIYDFAELLTDEEEQTLYNKMQNFIEKYNMDIAIVTINKNPKYSSMAFADDFYDYNGVGIGSEKSGLLFLIDMDKRVMWISTTGKAIKIYNDNRIDAILDYTYKKISKEDYNGCANEFIKYAEYFAKKGESGGDYIYNVAEVIKISLGISGIVTCIYIIIGCLKHKKPTKKREANLYVTTPIKITENSDIFLDKHVSKIYISSSSSGSSGGSSTHTGSSGTTHGGGGRSF